MKLNLGGKDTILMNFPSNLQGPFPFSTVLVLGPGDGRRLPRESLLQELQGDAGLPGAATQVSPTTTAKNRTPRTAHGFAAFPMAPMRS